MHYIILRGLKLFQIGYQAWITAEHCITNNIFENLQGHVVFTHIKSSRVLPNFMPLLQSDGAKYQVGKTNRDICAI
jgi:hypothetical protein